MIFSENSCTINCILSNNNNVYKYDKNEISPEFKNAIEMFLSKNERLKNVLKYVVKFLLAQGVRLNQTTGSSILTPATPSIIKCYQLLIG